ncbi:hypothetical protein DW870_01955 [Collinsella sp. AM38-1BH]|nr:hypothetical protein DWZ01_03505 [Collinsella sp. AF28-5AC]RHB82631.1 hypothetical protein DW870_01955 [Collinsella sp. AM38-1BH]
MGCDGHETCGHFSRPSTFLLCHSLFGADSALESVPFFGQHRQPPPSDADSSVIAFLDSYEVRFKVRRRTRGADGRRHLRRNKRK